MVSVSVTVTLFAKTILLTGGVPELLIIRLLKVSDPAGPVIVWILLPLNCTVLASALNTPVFVQSPPIL